MKRYNRELFKGVSAILIMGIVLFCQPSFAQKDTQPKKYTEVDPQPFADNAGHWYSIADKHNMINALPGKPRYKPSDITSIADNILLFQKENGGWPKNYDVFAILSNEQKDSVLAGKSATNTTYDNGSTYNQIVVLANVYTATGEEKYKTAALKGFDFVLKSQYKNGGWPQYYPIEKDNYSSHITFNDGALEGIINLLKDVKEGKPEYAFLDKEHRDKIVAAYNKAIPCILKMQINDGGKPTAWCQQHDEVTLQPTWARKFEPPSICNGESSGVVLFLMSLQNPSKEVIASVQNAVAWFKQSEMLNTRVKTIPADRMETPYRISTTDRVVVTDSTAPPIWTRYYELKTHRPLFCNRDSKVVYSLAEVDRERRDGYAWYTYAPQKVLDKYPEWQKKWNVQ